LNRRKEEKVEELQLAGAKQLWIKMKPADISLNADKNKEILEQNN
jgi:hypothetical protein